MRCEMHALQSCRVAWHVCAAQLWERPSLRPLGPPHFGSAPRLLVSDDMSSST